MVTQSRTDGVHRRESAGTILFFCLIQRVLEAKLKIEVTVTRYVGTKDSCAGFPLLVPIVVRVV